MKELLQELSTERTLREELSTKVAALQAEVDKLRPSKGHLATDDTDVHTGDALFTERKNELQPRDSEQQNTAKVLSNSMAKDETEEDREAGPWMKVGKNNRVENPIKEKATTQRSNEQSVPKKWNQPKQQLRYAQSQHRRPVVLGDSNAHRLKRQLHKDVSDWRLRVTTKPGATMEETLLRAEKEIEQGNSAETKLQLILHARTGSLATQQRRHELFDSEPSCRLRGAAEETVTHVLQDCPRLHDKPRTSPSLPELLGLSSQTEDNHFDRVNYTKDLLLRWDRLNREVATTSARETPHTPSSVAPRTDTPPPCGNGSKQTDEKLAGPVMLQGPSREQWLRQSTSITELPNTAAG
ncbi:hypothetical protein HPB52_006878 [Rhipicephalus sanguineus]|uniref:Uncharacterized protein n=1 Tax=Rhipicephalus sanguineus TaxID=34632 RepID=A0A9D4Q5V8_RHISA|nr:hypothetical protein HPB52_006878 [Rhipicephalus sanguineus]